MKKLLLITTCLIAMSEFAWAVECEFTPAEDQMADQAVALSHRMYLMDKEKQEVCQKIPLQEEYVRLIKQLAKVTNNRPGCGTGPEDPSWGVKQNQAGLEQLRKTCKGSK